MKEEAPVEKKEYKSPVALKATVEGIVSNGILTHGLRSKQWKEVNELDRPDSPFDEFVRHARKIPKHHLLWLWEGLNKEWEIEQIYRDDFAEEVTRQREMVQMFIGIGVNMPDITSPEFISAINSMNFMAELEVYRNDLKRLQTNQTRVPKTVYNQETGLVETHQVVREMTERERLQLGQNINLTHGRMMLQTKQASTIVESRKLEVTQEEKNAAKQELAQWKKETRSYMTVKEPTALPEASQETVIEGQIVQKEMEPSMRRST